MLREFVSIIKQFGLRLAILSILAIALALAWVQVAVTSKPQTISVGWLTEPLLALARDYSEAIAVGIFAFLILGYFVATGIYRRWSRNAVSNRLK